MYIKRVLFRVKSGQEEKAESVQSKWIIQLSTYSIKYLTEKVEFLTCVNTKLNISCTKHMKSPEIKHDTAIGENHQQYQITVRTDS